MYQKRKHLESYPPLITDFVETKKLISLKSKSNREKAA